MWKQSVFLGVLAVVLVTGCSRESEDAGTKESKAASEHVWKEQEQALDKARQLEQDMMDVQKSRAEAIEKQSQ